MTTEICANCGEEKKFHQYNSFPCRKFTPKTPQTSDSNHSQGEIRSKSVQDDKVGDTIKLEEGHMSSDNLSPDSFLGGTSEEPEESEFGSSSVESQSSDSPEVCECGHKSKEHLGKKGRGRCGD